MQVSFHLERRPDVAPASALLLLSRDPADLLRFCADVHTDALPQVYAVADGFLVRLPRPVNDSLSLRDHIAVRLRSLVDNLFVPVDADLLPALLPDEAADIVRHRGLVFLPGNRVLEFNPTQPLSIPALLTIPGVQHGDWQPLPEPTPLADHLTEIVIARPELPPEEILEAGAADPEDDEPESEGESLPRHVAGKGMVGAGRLMAFLGKLFGWKGLARRGMKWIESGMNMAPGLAKSVLDSQEATLRDLLRKFREGKVEQALRRALPLEGDSRGARPSANAKLPVNNLIYSLRNILGPSGGGGGIWMTDAQLFAELRREYLRQAELALERGDYRRAAFIHGKLLRDFRAAAAILSKGGLHHDAAILYLKKIDDPMAAAREFEAAGEIDRALEIYRLRGEHLLAGDMLRRAGDEERALEEYCQAADKLVKSGRGYYEAGELMRTRGGREDLALPYYKRGWAERPRGNPVPCAIRLAQVFTHAGKHTRLTALARRASAFLEPPGFESPAAEFFNELARLANQVPEEKVRDNLTDVALMGIAGKLRQRAATANLGLVSQMLGSQQTWAPAVISDAEFALKQARTQPVRPGRIESRVRLRARVPTVVAVCQAASSGEIFVAFQSGEVVCYQPRAGAVLNVTDDEREIVSMSTTAQGDALVVLRLMDEGGCLVHSFAGSPTLQSKSTWVFKDINEGSLAPGLCGDGYCFRAGIWNGRLLQVVGGPTLVPVRRVDLPESIIPTEVLLMSSVRRDRLAALVLHWAGVAYADDIQLFPEISTGTGMVPWSPGEVGLHVPVIGWQHTDHDRLNIVGVGRDGQVYFCEVARPLHRNEEPASGLRHWVHSHAGNQAFLAATINHRRLIAAVTAREVAWLRMDFGRLNPVANPTPIDVASTVACFPFQDELIIVCADGTLHRLPMRDRSFAVFQKSGL
jgi:tetratricopeptide (TPR) repeat protein